MQINGTDQYYLDAYNKLNPEQKQAVDETEGPVLVIAGPGTGKTQLLTTRVGHILATTDAAPNNILCLTFTESGAATMRDRLTKLIGKEAQDVTVSTYHSFGSDLIQTYPELINLKDEIRPADDLIIYKTIRQIVSNLDYDNPLKGENFIDDIKSLIGGYKRALITPDILNQICVDNLEFIEQANHLLSQHIGPDYKSNKSAIPILKDLLADSDGLTDRIPLGIVALKTLWIESLSQAIEEAEVINKTQPITKWKNDWLVKNDSGEFVIANEKETNRQMAMADIYRHYLKALRDQGYYDYDDMILFAIQGLETNQDIKLTLQERYQYIMLDEFQDTNEAQLRLVELLADNPANEGRPNILAVGDDDQAIYSFQGAHYAHMERFYNNYRDVKIVNLKRNYRSTPGIVSLATAIREQIEEKLNITDKQLISEKPKIKETVKRVELPLAIEHLAWTSGIIKQLVAQGHKPSDIAVLAPQHKYLETLIPYLNEANIAVRYDKRENILNNQAVIEIIDSSRLVLALKVADQELADFYWPKILSQAHWQLPASLIWQLSWEVKDNHLTWTQVVLNHPITKSIALFFIRLSQIEENSTYDGILNYILGNLPLELNEPGLTSFKSPYFNFYFQSLKDNTAKIDGESWNLIGQLSILIETINKSSDSRITLTDMINFIDDFTNAKLHMLDTKPFQQNSEAVNLMTAFAAKGMEFKTVFLINLLDDAWGSGSRKKSNGIGLPDNLKHVRNEQKGNDNQLRLLFVAASRAEQNLYLVSYGNTIDGKPTARLKFMSEHLDDNDRLISPLLPSPDRAIEQPNAPIMNTKLIVPAILNFHLNNMEPDQKSLLKNRLDNFSLSFTQFYSYLDVSSGGPAQFYLDHILKFPSLSNINAKYGTAVHATLNWHFVQTKINHVEPPVETTLLEFEKQLKRQNLDQITYEQLNKRGQSSLRAYFKQSGHIVGPNDLSEEKFSANIDGVRLNGKIDRLIINNANKTIRLVDYKTSIHQSKSFSESDMRMRKNKRQLYFYKLLVDTSARFKDYSINQGTIEFVEPDINSGKFNSATLEFDSKELEETKTLINSVWSKIMALDFPDTSSYPETTAGIRSFEQDILTN